MPDEKKRDSFLSDIQKDGKAKDGKLPIEDLDAAIANVHVIMDKDVAAQYRNKPEEEWPTLKLAVYSHECREIVPPGMGKGRKGKTRIVCGKTGSKKISMGRKEALEQYYHVDKKSESEKIAKEKKSS